MISLFSFSSFFGDGEKDSESAFDGFQCLGNVFRVVNATVCSLGCWNPDSVVSGSVNDE